MRPLTGALDDHLLADLRAAGVCCTRIGSSAEGRALHGCSIGSADLPLVSIVAGAHPDEPAGPVAALELLRGWQTQPLARRLRLAVVPILDVDGTAAQRAWLDPWDGAADLQRYATHRLRRALGADREFGWPGAPWGGTVLPECAAADAFLDGQGPAIAHLSLHGMALAAGAWFLVDRPGLRDAQLWRDLRTIADERGFGLHDIPRYGDKDFRRAGRGFCTTPSGPGMRRWALGAQRLQEARAVAFGSMDAARSRAHSAGAAAPICAVSEFPLFQIPAADRQAPGFWRDRIAQLVLDGAPATAFTDLLRKHDGRAVPLADQVAGMQAMTHAVIAAALRRQPS